MRILPLCLLLPLLLLLQPHATKAVNIYGQTSVRQRTVSERLMFLGSKVDANRDSDVTSEEIAKWARTLGRPVPDTNPSPDEVSCVEQDEFVAGMKAEGFSDLFAESLTDFLLQYSATPAPASSGSSGSGGGSGGTSGGSGGTSGGSGGTSGGSGGTSGGSGGTSGGSGGTSGGSGGTSGGSGGTAGTGGATCTGLDTQTILDNAAKGTITKNKTSDFVARFLKYLSDFCQDFSGANAGVDLYSTNEDCKNLPNACAVPPFGCESVCVNYTFVTTASNTTGAFSQRVHLQEDWARRVPPRDFPVKLEAMFQDTDGNGVFSIAEQTENLQKNFDLNNDSCVERTEYNAKMSTSLCGGFDFSEDYVSAKFAELTGAPQQPPPPAQQQQPAQQQPAASSGSCQGIDVNLPNGADLAETDFLNNYTKTLVDLCEKDPDLYKTNDDCKQLDMTCRLAPKTSATQACKDYVAAIDARATNPSSNTGIKFYQFARKFGASYEDLFGKN